MQNFVRLFVYGMAQPLMRSDIESIARVGRLDRSFSELESIFAHLP